MKILWRLGKEAIRYKALYIIAILSTFCLTAVNLAAPKVLSAMTGLVARGVDRMAMTYRVLYRMASRLSRHNSFTGMPPFAPIV